MVKRRASTDINLTSNSMVTDGESMVVKKKPRTSTTTKNERTSIPRDETPHKILLNTVLESDAHINIVSANVAGLRGVLNNENKRAYLIELLSKTKPDVFCIQEHKLQDMHLTSLEKDLDDIFNGYSRYFTCSGPPAKKGYSGVACFVKDGGPTTTTTATDTTAITRGNKNIEVLNVTYGLGENHQSDCISTNEGRVVTLEFPSFYLINSYVPNSGQKLERLDYRVKNWDIQFGNYLKSLEVGGKPVLLIGDLNVAHQYRDMHNFYAVGNFDELPFDASAYKLKAKPLLKQSGCTVLERNSFSNFLESNNFVDSFHSLHPKSEGCFTYWSTRAGNRAVNRGLRLDYCIVSKTMMEDVDSNEGVKLVDSYILDYLDEYPSFSDHCPVGCVLKIEE